jgi:hypothetical protein
MMKGERTVNISIYQLFVTLVSRSIVGRTGLVCGQGSSRYLGFYFRYSYSQSAFFPGYIGASLTLQTRLNASSNANHPYNGILQPLDSTR